MPAFISFFLLAWQPGGCVCGSFQISGFGALRKAKPHVEKNQLPKKGQAQHTKHKLVSLDADHGNYRKYRCKRIPWFVHGHVSECCCSRGFFSTVDNPHTRRPRHRECLEPITIDPSPPHPPQS